MKKLLPLTLISSLLLAACTTQTPTPPVTGQTLEGEVRLNATESGRPSPYENAQAAGRTLALLPVTPQDAPVSVLPRTTVRQDLWYTLNLPGRVTIPENAVPALLGAPDEDTAEACDTKYEVNHPAVRTMQATFRLSLPDTEEGLALNPIRRNATGDDADQGSTYQLVYAAADVREQRRVVCDTLLGRDEVISDLNLKRGWNVVVTQRTTSFTDAGYFTTQRTQVTDDLTHHLVLAR